MNCNFINNHATSQGGAIYVGKWDAENDATVIAVNTTFINNYADSEGGAIYIAADNLDGQSTSASFYFYITTRVKMIIESSITLLVVMLMK